ARKGIDYFSSAEPAELARLVPMLRDAARAIGVTAYAMSEAELTYMHQVKKSLVAAADLTAGVALTEAGVTYKRAPADAHPLTFAGRPSLEHLFDRLKLSKRASAVVLCTSTHPDDTVLAELAEKNGMPWFRGSEDDVLKRFLDAATREGADVIARVTGDDVLI